MHKLSKPERQAKLLAAIRANPYLRRWLKRADKEAAPQQRQVHTIAPTHRAAAPAATTILATL